MCALFCVPQADSRTDTDFSESPPRTPATPDLDAGRLAAMMEAVWPIAALSHSGTKICAKSCNYGSMSSTEILSCFYDILPTYEIVETFRQSVLRLNSPLLPTPTLGSHFYASSPVSDDGGSISAQSAYTQSPSPSADPRTDTAFSESPPRTPVTPDLDAGSLAAVMEARTRKPTSRVFFDRIAELSQSRWGASFDMGMSGSNVYSPSPVSEDGGSIYGQSAYTQSPSPSADSQTDTDFSESPPRTPATRDLDAGPLAAVMEARTRKSTRLCFLILSLNCHRADGETFRQSVLPAPTPGSNVYSPSPVSDDGGSIYGQSAYTQSPSPSADSRTDTAFSESPPRTPATPDLN
ncbi:hypothetical protein Efla_000750 [Eimeria flavescens]